MSVVIKVGLLGIAGVLIAMQFRENKPEYASFIGLAIAIVIFSFATKQFQQVLAELSAVQDYLGAGKSYLVILLKVLGITYICEFSASICQDAGYGTVARQIEVLGKLSVMFAGLPVLLAVMEQLQSFVG